MLALYKSHAFSVLRITHFLLAQEMEIQLMEDLRFRACSFDLQSTFPFANAPTG